MPSALARLRDLVDAHLHDEEAEAIPLVRRHLSSDDLERVAKAQRRKAGMSGAKAFLPWILDEAAPADRATVLREVPPPLRWLLKGWERQRQAAFERAH